MRRTSHFCIATKRLLIRRVDDGKKILGNAIIMITIGNPISVGVMKEANRFSFIWFLKELCVFGTWLEKVQGLSNNNVLKSLIGK